jgi:anti-sigma factor RsiW
MTCHKIEELLPLYAEEGLDAQDRQRVETHLAGCPDCRHLLACLKQTETGLARFPQLEVSPTLMARLQAIPSSAKKKIRPQTRARFFLAKPSLQPVLAGAFLLLVFAATLVFTPAGGRLLKSLDRQFHLGYSQVEKLYAKAESLADSLNSKKEEVIVALKSASPLSRDENE